VGGLSKVNFVAKFAQPAVTLPFTQS